MTKLSFFACLAAGMTLASALPVYAADLPDGASQAVLVAPTAKPVEGVIDGRIWRCEGATCTANANDSADEQKPTAECHRAAQWLGQFSTYQTGAKVLTAAELATCNARITTKEPHIPG